MPKKKKPTYDPNQPSLLELSLKTAPAVPGIRDAVRTWVDSGYPGATETTKTLLKHWFHPEGHRQHTNNTVFRYHHFQKGAIETLIYLYEVAQQRSHKALVESYVPKTIEQDAPLRLLQYDFFPRYCIKMATGSGKTKVIALAIAWHYFNAVLEDDQHYAKTSLIIAPNVIVLERLATDFAGGRIFRTDPIIPPTLKIHWDMDFYMRGETERHSSHGALYLTNIQQLYEQKTNAAEANEPDAMSAILGPVPPPDLHQEDRFSERIIARGGPVFVANDEAHHTHDEESEWNRSIRRLHAATQRDERSSVIQLDVSATPRYTKGALFTWTVFDYPLKQAIIDNIVKHPIKGITSGIREVPSDVASVRYESYLTAGVQRWREYCDIFTKSKLNKKPVLFVMMNSTKDADDVAGYLRDKYPDHFAGEKLLTIHTNQSGDISKKDLGTARKAARDIDEGTSPINCIVSVLMLREGWDVQSVTVVVGLRPYSSKANILPEQTIGRGLRLMFRGTSSYKERVDIIGNDSFIKFVEQLEKDEDLELETFDPEKDRVVIETIYPDDEKMNYDIAIPMLSPIFTRKQTFQQEVDNLDVATLKLKPPLPKKQSDAEAKTFTYEGYDIISLEKMIEREYTIPTVQTAQEVISYYAKLIAADLKLPSQFALLVPKVRQFLQAVAFGQSVDLDDPVIIKAISQNAAQYVTKREFTKALRDKIVEEQTPTLERADRLLSTCPGFPWSRATYDADKTVFNRVPVDNEFEKTFARFLEKAPDVQRFAKFPQQFNFTIPYTDSKANLRYYEPDFVAVTDDGTYHLIETKGREDIDVQHKDHAAQLWCENASLLTGNEWLYHKVLQTEFDKLQPSDFGDILML